MGGEDEGLRIYRFGVDEEKCPHCGWRVSTAYVVASSEDEAKNLVENGIWLCGNCMADTLVDREYILKSGRRVGGHPHTPRMR